MLVDSTYITASGENTTGQLTAPQYKTTDFFTAGRIQDDELTTDIIGMNTSLGDTEYCVNGDMEDDSNWTSVNTPDTNERSAVQVHGDSYSRHVVDTTPSYAGIRSDTFTSTTGKAYRVSGYYYLPKVSSTELVANSGFETSGAGGADVFASWTETTDGSSTINRDTSNKYSGDASCRMDIDGDDSVAMLNQVVTLVIGKQYRLSLWYKHEGSDISRLLFTDSPAGDHTLQSNGTWVGSSIELPNSTTWAYFSVDFYPIGDHTDYTLQVSRFNNENNSIWFDAVSVREIYNSIMRTVFTRGVDGMGQNIAWVSNYDEWTYFTGEYTETNGGDNASAAFINNSGTEPIEFYVDDISVKEIINKYTEIEWCIEATDYAVEGDTYEFRVTKGTG